MLWDAERDTEVADRSASGRLKPSWLLFEELGSSGDFSQKLVRQLLASGRVDEEVSTTTGVVKRLFFLKLCVMRSCAV